MLIKRNIFDFEVGYLTRSPCKECLLKDNFPDCLDKCIILDKIHKKLARGVPSNYSATE